MEIIVNGFKETVPDNSKISDLIVFFEEGDAHLVVELNGRFVYPNRYDSTVVSEGDRIELINPSFGG
jgi:sulfur carrier protein